MISRTEEQISSTTFLCPFCDFKSLVKDSLKIHIEHDHFRDRKSAFNEPGIQNALEIGDSDSKCDYCEFKGSSSELTNHLQVIHVNIVSCGDCGSLFVDEKTRHVCLDVLGL